MENIYTTFSKYKLMAKMRVTAVTRMWSPDTAVS
jgi:hypothetical protein